MGRRLSQRKLELQSQENNQQKRPQRRKHKSNTSSTKCRGRQHSVLVGTSMSNPVASEDDGMKIKVPTAAENRKQKHTCLRVNKHKSAPLCHSLSRSSPEQQEEQSPKQEKESRRSPLQQDSDTDLSDTERLPTSSCSIPPQLELRSEVIEDDEPSSPRQRFRGRDPEGLNFPDFLPPPFNSWNLSQLAVFYHTEGRGTLRPRPVGPLEQYLERLLELEWCQIQSVQAEQGSLEVSGGVSSCQRSTAAASSRLSSPKCILQCQRAFPLSFLSSLASHSTLLSGCGCTLSRITCNTSRSRSIHSHCNQSRLSVMPDRSRGPTALPKRSCSESRVHSTDRMLRVQMLGSPTKTDSYLKRMQASGNIRNRIPGAAGSSQSSIRSGSDQAGRGKGSDCTAGRLKKRSGSGQRDSGGDRCFNRQETSQSSSDCRKGTREVNCTEEEIKPDGVTAIINHLPCSEYSAVQRPIRSKLVEFVT